MAVQYRPGFGPTQPFMQPTPGWKTEVQSSGPTTPKIAPPDIKPFELSTDAQSYPTWLRNLGENAAQQKYQRDINTIGAGNSAQRLMHAQDSLNNARMGYMAQAGQQDLTVQNVLQDAWARYNELLAQLYGTQVAQRGQDVSYAASIDRPVGGGAVLRLGGGSRPPQAPTAPTYKALGGGLADHYKMNQRVSSSPYSGSSVGW